MGKKRICLTGYGSFSCYGVNPSSVVVKRLAEKEFQDVELTTTILDVDYNTVQKFAGRIAEGEVEAEVSLHPTEHNT